MTPRPRRYPRTPISDGNLPHQYPPRPTDPDKIDAWADALAWRCQACGEWIHEFGPLNESSCTVDWRNKLGEARQLA